MLDFYQIVLLKLYNDQISQKYNFTNITYNDIKILLKNQRLSYISSNQIGKNGIFKRLTTVLSKGGIDMCRYEKHGEMIGRLRSLERQYGRQGLVKIGSIGKSVSGRDLIYIKISRNATGPRQMTEPMFKYE